MWYQHDEEVQILVMKSASQGYDQGKKWKSLSNLAMKIWGTFGTVLKYDDFRNREVCFQDIAFAVHGWVAPNIIVGNQDVQSCRRSQMYLDFSEWLLKKFHLATARHAHENTRRDESVPISAVRVSIIVRKHADAVAGSRLIVNQQEVIDGIQSLSGDTSAGGRDILIRQLVMEDLSFEEQLAAMGTTDLLVAMHGAGLTNLVFLPSTSGIVELRTVPSSVLFNNPNGSSLHCHRVSASASDVQLHVRRYK